MPITLRIERLVLEGVTLSASQRTALVASIRSELTMLLEGGLHPALAGGGAVPAVRAPAVRLETPLNPARAGAQIARAVYSGLGAPTDRRLRPQRRHASA